VLAEVHAALVWDGARLSEALECTPAESAGTTVCFVLPHLVLEWEENQSGKKVLFGLIALDACARAA